MLFNTIWFKIFGLSFWLKCVLSVKTPHAKIEALYPRGLRVSIKDSLAIRLFAFHGNLNVKMHGLEFGQWALAAEDPVDGRWTILDKMAKLNMGDTIYFWTQIFYAHREAKNSYRQEEGMFLITDFVYPNGTTVNSEVTLIDSLFAAGMSPKEAIHHSTTPPLQNTHSNQPINSELAPQKDVQFKIKIVLKKKKKKKKGRGKKGRHEKTRKTIKARH